MARWPVIGALASAVAIAGGVVYATQHGGGSTAAKETLVAAEPGDVAITVGGVGHVNTLTGAAQLAVPSGPSGSGGGTGTGTASGSKSGSASGPGSAGTSGGGPTQVSADAVFPAVPGHVQRVMVRVGDTVVAGEPVAALSDDGASAAAALQARNDLDTARLELAQKRIQDPLRGAPPTAAEAVAGRQAIASARAKLARTLGPPLPADVATARLDVAKALADLHNARAGTPAAVASAELAVVTAQHKLETVTGAPNPTDVIAAQLELAKATLDQETLLATPPAPNPSAVNAADLAIAAAQAKLTEALASGTPIDVAAARAELAKAQSERDTLLRSPPAPTAVARIAAQLNVDAARRRLDALMSPPAAVVTAARGDLARAEADLQALRATRGSTGIGAARAGVKAAKRKLAQVTGPPKGDVVAAARFDVRKAEADLAVLRQRGAPASAIDLALARLKIDVAQQRVGLAAEQARRLTVLAPASGTVTSVLTTRGAAVDAATPVARVQDLSHLVVTVDLSEFDVARIRTGSPARISVDALGGQGFRGTVIDVAATGIDTGGVVNFPVVIALKSGGRLRPGMSVSARIDVRRRTHVLRIPVAAVNDQGGRPTVLVRDGSGATRRHTIEPGLAGPRYVEVRSGLQVGENVVVPAGGG